jgi:integral membrane sensor domain MASE1
MKNQKLQIWIWPLIIVGMILGVIMGVYFFNDNPSNLSLAIAIPLGAVLGFLIFYLLSKRSKRKNGNTPSFDERNALMMQQFLVIAQNVIMLVVGTALVITYAKGITSINIEVLIVCWMILFILIGLGALLAKRL